MRGNDGTIGVLDMWYQCGSCLFCGAPIWAYQDTLKKNMPITQFSCKCRDEGVTVPPPVSVPTPQPWAPGPYTYPLPKEVEDVYLSNERGDCKVETQNFD